MTPPRGPESRYHGTARVTRQGMQGQPAPAADGAPGSGLAAMVTALAEVTAAQAEEHLTWNQIAERYGYPSGKQARKDVHALRGHVTRQLRLAQNRGQDARMRP